MKKTLKYLTLFWVTFCTAAVTICLGYSLYLRISTPTTSLPSLAGQCLDSGGTWDSGQKICIRAS